jgi:single-stranded DNA-binding protein
LARVNFGGANIDVRGYVNHIGEIRQAGQAQVLDTLIGWTTAPKKGETEGKRQTVKASIWNYGGNRDDIAMFLRFVKKGDQITVSGPVELDSYQKKDGSTESMMRMTIDVFTPAGRENGASNGSNGGGAVISAASNGSSRVNTAVLDAPGSEEIPF